MKSSLRSRNSLPLDLIRRQTGVSSNYADSEGDGGFGSGWWNSPIAFAIKWAVVIGFVLFLATFMLGGYAHAKHRMKKGKDPLRYHRVCLPHLLPHRFLRLQAPFVAGPLSSDTFASWSFTSRERKRWRRPADMTSFGFAVDDLTISETTMVARTRTA